MLNSKQRAMLKKYIAQTPAICFVGKEGLSENCLASITQALTAREVIKIAVLQNCDLTAREVADQIEKTLKADIVSVVGKKIIAYKYSAFAKKHVDISCQ
jgi:RNA-binding protein